MTFRFAASTPRLASALAALALSLLAGPLSPRAIADTLTLRSGDRISGRIVAFKANTMTIETSYAGTLDVPASALVSATTDETVTVEFTDGSRASGLLHPAGPGTMAISGGRTAPRTGFVFADVAAISRGETPPSRFIWSGRVNAGLTQTQGNSDTQTVSAKAAVKGRSKESRITADLDYNREADSGNETVNNARIRGKFDNFINERLYVYANGSLQRDPIADLTLRSIAGAGAGYQVFDTPETSLSLEAGAAYVHETYSTTGDTDAADLRWAVDYERKLFGRVVTFFHDHEGYLDVKHDNRVLVNSRTGLRVPFRAVFNVTAEVDADYNSAPPPGTKATDLRYILSLGYEW